MSRPVQISMDEADFRLLIHNAARWAGHGWEEKLSRFEVQGAPDIPPGTEWQMAYWVGSEYTTVVLARSFLASRGYESQTVVDLTGNDWVVLTDYDDWRAGK
jgi:hypothetical protein